MSFRRILTDTKIAVQITALINKYNQLGTVHDIDEILSNSNEYIIETFKNIVVGCIRVNKQSYNITELKHLCVTELLRKQGIAKTLVEAGIKSSQTPLIYAMVRRDNEGSIKTFGSAGFKIVGGYQTDEKIILCLIKTAPKWVPNVNVQNQ